MNDHDLILTLQHLNKMRVLTAEQRQAATGKHC